ncbi:MAG: LPS assembly lipoprotein LptE [Sulfurovum sp.]
MNTIVKFWMTVSMVLLVSACGYKPSSHMIQNVFSDTVYVEVIVDRAEPENAPYVKDEMNRLIYTRFKGRVVPKEQAQSQIRLSYTGSTFTPLSYENGYVTRYRANIRVKFDMVNKEGKVSKTISSIVESDIQESSLTSSVLRTEAIGKGLAKALDEFLAYVSAKGMLKEGK